MDNNKRRHQDEDEAEAEGCSGRKKVPPPPPNISGNQPPPTRPPKAKKSELDQGLSVSLSDEWGVARPPPPPAVLLRPPPPPPPSGLSSPPSGIQRPPPPPSGLQRPPSCLQRPPIKVDEEEKKVPFKMGLTRPKGGLGIAIKLGGPKKAQEVKVESTRPTKVASVFAADDSSDEEEEMPTEAKMRMRNIGRETITSSGPNSFGKTKQGFTDAKKLFERNLQEAMEKVSKE